MKNLKKLKNGYLPFLITASSAVSLRLLFLPLLLSFKITDYNEKLVVSNKSVSTKASAISVDRSSHEEVFGKTGILTIFSKIHEKSLYWNVFFFFQGRFSSLHYFLHFKNKRLGMKLSKILLQI